ncbi:MAG: ASCH domain-containing protein [Candidatus Aenigmarchaeota archaeon]|nr:ASCH domain-containing protein [Candidatus Aenigmarchaeota archaeon]
MPAREYRPVHIFKLVGKLKKDFPEHALKPYTELKMYEDSARLFEDGMKTLTVRYEKNAVCYPISTKLHLIGTRPGQANYRRPIGFVEIKRMMVKPFGQLDEKDAAGECALDIRELKASLQKIYGPIADHELVSVFHLR